MLAVIAIVAVQLVVAALLFGTLLLDRRPETPQVAELRHRGR